MTIDATTLARRERRRAARWHKRQARLNRRYPPRKSRLGEAGTARGACIDVGCVEGGWTLPPPVTLGDGTNIQLYKDGQGITAAFAAIKSAREQICLECYIFHSDPTGRAFAEALCEKARSGVRVYLIFDSFGCFDSDPAMFLQMRSAGVHVAEFHPLRYWDCAQSWRPFSRDHRKMLVIDSRIAGIGGLNIGSEYGSSSFAPRARRFDLWRDNSIGIIGPGAVPFAECFAHMWKYVHAGGPMRTAEMIRNVDLPNRYHDAEQITPPTPVYADLGLLASAPSGRSPLLPFLRNLIGSARRSLDLTIAYFAPSNLLIGELIRAAGRGVRVRLMFPGKSDMRLVRFATRSFYECLLGAGIEVWERQGAVLHAKTIVIDDETTIIGSTNLDYRSIEFNCELSAVIRSRQFGGQMTRLFEHDICFAERMVLSQWRRRPFLDRMVQWTASQVRHLL